MITEPFTILLLAGVVVGAVFIVIWNRPRWRGFGLLSCVILGILLGNIGVIDAAPGVLPVLFSSTTYLFIALMVMTVDVRRIFKTAGRPLAMFWGVAAITLVGGTVAYLLFRGSLGDLAAPAAAIVSSGSFGHTETQLAVATAAGAGAILPVIVAVAIVRTLTFELVGFATVRFADRINQRFLRPNFFYADDPEEKRMLSTGTVPSSAPGGPGLQTPTKTRTVTIAPVTTKTNEASIAISLGWAGLITLVAVDLSPVLGWGSTGVFVILIVLSLALGTFGGAHVKKLQDASHSVGTYLSFVSLTLIGATTSLATLREAGGPILGVMVTVIIFTLVGGILLGWLLKVDWATIAITLVMADTGTASGAACAVAYGATKNVPIAVITSLSGSTIGVFVGLGYLQLLTLL